MGLFVMGALVPLTSVNIPLGAADQLYKNQAGAMVDDRSTVLNDPLLGLARWVCASCAQGRRSTPPSG